jgi:hypothetical protein
MPIRRPKKRLNTIHVPVQMRRWRRFLGSWTEERMRGMVGRRKRASWCWKMERTKTPEMAE